MSAGTKRLTSGRFLLTGGVAGPALFVGSFLVQGALRSGYDPLRHPVSALSLGPDGWAQQVTFWLTGALIAAFALGLRTAGVGRAVPILLGVVGIGMMGAGLFACDPISGYPPGSPVPAPRTWHGVAHDLSSAPFFTVLPAAMIVLARRFRREGLRTWALISAIAAAAHVGCFVLARFGFSQLPALMPWAGLWQRLCLVVGLGWTAALAWWLYRRAGRPQRS